jgi:hypothetical protein
MFLQERGELGRQNDPETAGPRLAVDLDQAAAAPSRAPAGVTRAVIRAGRRAGARVPLAAVGSRRPMLHE